MEAEDLKSGSARFAQEVLQSLQQLIYDPAGLLVVREQKDFEELAQRAEMR